MIEEEQEEVMGENISSLRERIFNMTSSTINSNEESDLPTLAFEDCQSLLDFSATSGITSQVKTIDYHFNLPSDHLCLLLANPQKASYLSALSDYTENQCLSVQQGEKWRRNPLFQHPFIQTNGKDFWIGDVAVLHSGQSILVERFYMKDMLALFDGYLVEQGSDSEDHALHKVQSSPVTYEIKYLVSAWLPPMFYSHPKNWSSSGEASLNPTHHGLLFKSHPMKKPVFNSANQFIQFQKAIITPLAIFSDDTSGNLMKTHGMYDSVLVNFPAMPYSMRNRCENNFFVTAVSQQAGFKSTHLMPIIATDLKTLENGVDMYSSTYDETVTPTNKALILADLGYSHTGTDDLLCLQSFDPALDTPVEILHTVALGVCKYLVNHLFKEVLKGNTASQVKLSDLLEQKKGSRDFTRTFRKKLRHSRSYLGKEFKILVQVLPPILNTEFTDNTEVKVDSDFDQYLNNVDNTACRLVKPLYEYDIYANTKFSLTLKTHLLLHLKEDIKRFGCALHFETEKGKQFNKFIRTHLMYSNHHADNRDLALKFGKQDMLRHIARIKFSNNFFGKHQEFVDNNHVKTKIVAGVSVAFSYSNNANRMFVGRVVESNSVLRIQHYQLFSPNLNLVTVGCQPIEHYCNLEDVKIECMLHLTSGSETQNYHFYTRISLGVIHSILPLKNYILQKSHDI
ncbi:hypothetical protein F4703DRAFT_1975624 [Phycomyces blakesleeanus]